MDTRSSLPNTATGCKACVYCGGPSNTNDHTPPKCLLRPPLPSDLITVPACRRCNEGFSFDEMVVRSLITAISSHPEMSADREPGGWLERTTTRNPKVREVLQSGRKEDGNYHFTGDLLTSFERVFRKTAQGMFFGLYYRIVPADQIHLFRVADRRQQTAEQLIGETRPNPLRDITDEPLSEISPEQLAYP